MNQGINSSHNKEVATLGGGCFWCLESRFKDLTGGEEIVVGYSGGTVPGPSYEQACTGKAAHAKVEKFQNQYSPKIKRRPAKA